MWFLGAGASFASGIPTANAMIWEFKRQLYCTAERVGVASCADLNDPVVQERLQRFCDGKRRFPARYSAEEYAAYFEAAYPDPADRHRYVLRAVRDGKPSYGHVVLGSLLLMAAARIVWTTNFDTVVEDAAIPLLEGSARLTVATLETADVARTALLERRDPVVVKLHGDFRSKQLKNIERELRDQDETLRRSFIEECQRSGLAVIGYSGRDHSVMDALTEAIAAGRGFPSGLFWFYREDAPPSDAVRDLVTTAQTAGVDAHLIVVETFDELMGDVIALFPKVPDKARTRLQALDRRMTRVSDAPLGPTGLPAGTAVVRLNALPVLEAPAVCRRIACSVGGITEVRAAVNVAGASLVVTRRKNGVLAFGRDDESRRVFQAYAITEFDVQPTETWRLTHDDSQEIGMFSEALARAIARERPLRWQRRGRRFELAVDPERTGDIGLAPLQRAVGQVAGAVPGTDITWAEGVRLHLQHRLERLWLLLEPKIWLSETSDASGLALARNFGRRRLTARHNRAVDGLLTGWIEVITMGAAEARVSAFGLREGEGVDASFVLGHRSGFSRRNEGLATQPPSPSPYRDR
jgi:NAD-dependent SIR2 family protein deacetylase